MHYSFKSLRLYAKTQLETTYWVPTISVEIKTQQPTRPPILAEPLLGFSELQTAQHAIYNLVAALFDPVKPSDHQKHLDLNKWPLNAAHPATLVKQAARILSNGSDVAVSGRVSETAM